MFRFHALIFVLTVALTPLLADRLLGQDTWEQYLDRLARDRRAAALQQERWAEQRVRETEAWRQAKAAAEDPLLELPNSGLPPGKYSIRLPFGVTRRVVVEESPTRPVAAAALSEQTYGDIFAYVRRMNKQFADLKLELHRLNEQDLAAEAGRALDSGINLAGVVSARRSAEEIKSRFAECDKLWQPLAYRLAMRDNLGTFVRQAASDIEGLCNGLERLLNAAPVAIYDRPVVAVLTGELARATTNLATDLQLAALNPPNRAALEALAVRVQRQAADLDAAVKANSALANIVLEYEEFVRVWDRLREEAVLAPEIDKHLRTIARRVREIDVQLHPALYVNLPLLTTHQQVVNLSTAITRTAAHLADDLEADALDSDRDVVYEARLFTRVAQELNRALAQTQPADVQQKAQRDFTGAWQRLETNLAKLPPARFEHGLAIAAELKKDVRRLQAELGQL